MALLVPAYSIAAHSLYQELQRRVEEGLVLRAGPAAGHTVMTHFACKLVSMETGVWRGGKVWELSKAICLSGRWGLALGPLPQIPVLGPICPHKVFPTKGP